MSASIKDMLTLLQSVNSKLDLFIPDLTIEKEVRHFLQKDKRTIDKWIKENRLKKDVHYFYSDDKIVFIPDAIIEFKKMGCKMDTFSASQKVISNILRG